MLIKYQSFEVPHEEKSCQWPRNGMLSEPRNCRYFKFLLIPTIIGLMLLFILINVNFEEDLKNPKSDHNAAATYSVIDQHLTELPTIGILSKKGNTLVGETVDDKELEQQLPDEYVNILGAIEEDPQLQKSEVPYKIEMKLQDLLKTNSKANNYIHSTTVLPTEMNELEERPTTIQFKHLTANKGKSKQDSQTQTPKNVDDVIGNSAKSTQEVKPNADVGITNKVTQNLADETNLQNIEITYPFDGKIDFEKGIGQNPSLKYSDDNGNKTILTRYSFTIGNTKKLLTTRRHRQFEHQGKNGINSYMANSSIGKFHGEKGSSSFQHKYESGIEGDTYCIHLKSTTDTMKFHRSKRYNKKEHSATRNIENSAYMLTALMRKISGENDSSNFQQSDENSNDIVGNLRESTEDFNHSVGNARRANLKTGKTYLEENFQSSQHKVAVTHREKLFAHLRTYSQNGRHEQTDSFRIQIANYTTQNLNKRSGNFSLPTIATHHPNMRSGNITLPTTAPRIPYYNLMSRIRPFESIFDYNTLNLDQGTDIPPLQVNITSGPPLAVTDMRHHFAKRQVDTITNMAGSASCTEDRTNCILTCTDGSVSFIDQDLAYLQTACYNRELTLILNNCVFVNGIMKSSFFVGDYKLKAVSIINCNLDTIQAGAFKVSTVKNIQSLELVTNAITALAIDTFEGLEKLVNFRFLQEPLTDNSFTGSEFLKPMAATLQNATIMQKTVLNVPVNPKDWLQGTDLKSLYTLDLSNNNLQGILDADSFRSLVAIRRLHLENCSLDFIDKTPFDAIRNLYILCLNNNRLKALDTMFLGNIHSRGIVLSAKGNEWKCDCENKEMIEYLQGLAFSSSLNWEEYICYEPSEWKHLNMFNITLDCMTTIGDNTTTTISTTSVVTEDDGTTKGITSSPVVTEDDKTTKDITTSPVVTEDNNTTKAITTSPVVTEDDNTTKAITTSPVVTENDNTTKAITTSPVVTEDDKTAEDITTSPVEITTDSTTTSDTTTVTSTTSLVTDDDDLADVDYIECSNGHTSETTLFPVKSSLVHFNISASATIVTITSSYNYVDSYIIYFKNHSHYANATQISQEEWRIQDLHWGETYLFCLVNGIGSNISPFDCRPHRLTLPLESWLQVEDIPWFITVIALVALHCCIIGSIVVYYIFRKRSKRFLNSQPTYAINEKSPIISRSSRVSLRHHDQATYLSPKPLRNAASKAPTLLYASPPLEAAPTIPNVYQGQPSTRCLKSTSKSQDAVYIDLIVHYEETVSNLSNKYNEISYPYICKEQTNEVCVKDDDYHVIDHYEEIQF